MTAISTATPMAGIALNNARPGRPERACTAWPGTRSGTGDSRRARAARMVSAFGSLTGPTAGGPVTGKGGGVAVSPSAEVAASANALQVWKRSSGFLAMALAITSSNASRAGSIADGFGGGSDKCACITANADDRRYGCVPVSILNRVAPNA